MTALILAVALSTGSVGTPMLGGVATYFDAAPGTAAAGPALRHALGPDWRGQAVTVCTDRCVRVTLDDWCACGMRHGKDTLLDLSRASFAAIGDLSAGVLAVTVEWGGPAMTLPPTDTSPDWSYWHEVVM